MTCEEVIRFLYPLVDDELSVDTTTTVMHHLEGCAPCQAVWNALGSLRSRLRHFETKIPIPERLTDGVRARVSANRKGAGTMTSRLWLSAAAACLVALCLVFCFFLGQSKPKALISSDLIEYYRGHDRLQTAHSVRLSPAQIVSETGLEPINFPGWALVTAEICYLGDQRQQLVHLTYTAVVDGKAQSIDCFELPRGSFDPRGLYKQLINGRTLCCGRIDDLSIIELPAAKQDDILVSSMPEEKLFSLAPGI